MYSTSFTVKPLSKMQYVESFKEVEYLCKALNKGVTISKRTHKTAAAAKMAAQEETSATKEH